MADADLTPEDAAVALRSLPRRFREALARATLSPDHGDDDDAGYDEDPTLRPDPEAIDERAVRMGTDGMSPLDHLSAATAELALFSNAVRSVLAGSPTPLHPALVDPSAREWDTPAGLNVDDALELLEAEAVSFADLIESAQATEWTRAGSTAGGGEVSSLGLVTEAVRSAVTHLRSIG